jgi:hypothetical protein
MALILGLKFYGLNYKRFFFKTIAVMTRKTGVTFENLAGRKTNPGYIQETLNLSKSGVTVYYSENFKIYLIQTDSCRLFILSLTLP